MKSVTDMTDEEKRAIEDMEKGMEAYERVYMLSSVQHVSVLIRDLCMCTCVYRLF